jgi:hypothetical protein
MSWIHSCMPSSLLLALVSLSHCDFFLFGALWYYLSGRIRPTVYSSQTTLPHSVLGIRWKQNIALDTILCACVRPFAAYYRFGVVILKFRIKISIHLTKCVSYCFHSNYRESNLSLDRPARIFLPSHVYCWPLNRRFVALCLLADFDSNNI